LENRLAIIKTAHEVYAERSADVDLKLEALRLKMKAHSQREQMDPKNWGYSGDAAHVLELLTAAVDFLS
jgi:hypothetical protein